MSDHQRNLLVREARFELVEHILPFWMEKMTDRDNGGFYGRMDGENRIHPKAEKGGILNARILWTFSAAFRHLKLDTCLNFAQRARDYIVGNFFDEPWGGTYWSLDFTGKPADAKKQIYAQAFFLYALSEYFLATGDKESKEKAIQLFRLIEQHSFDADQNGYLEAFDREWNLLDDLRLSEKDANEKKTMNTHLHILEAYTNLYRIWPGELLAERLRNLIGLFLQKIIDPESHHLILFFDEGWQRKSTVISYGHDIECTWLLAEAAGVLGDKTLADRVGEASLRIVAAVEEGLRSDGSIIYEEDRITGHRDEDRHWWPQAEAVIGFYNAFERTGQQKYLDRAVSCFRYIQQYLIDPTNGEWYWSRKADGGINVKDDKAGFWKCPYHNGRMCLEIIQRMS